MNINQIGLYNQNSNKSNKVPSRTPDIGTTAKSPHIRVGKSRIQNALASSSNIYGRNPGAENYVNATEESIAKNAAEHFEDIKNRMTKDDAKDIEDEGMSLEKYNMERLDRTLTRIKKQRQMKRNAVEDSVDRREQQAEDVEKAVVHAAMQGMNSSQITTALENANLPITEENIVKIAQAVDMSQAAAHITDVGIEYMLANDLEPTIFHFYQAEHIGKNMIAGSAQNNVGMYEAVNVAYDVSDAAGSYQAKAEDWLQIKDQVAEVVEQAGLDATDEVMEQCQWLFEKDLPITEESIKGLLELNEIKANYNQNEVLKQVIQSFELGVHPEDTDLGVLANQEQPFDLESFLQGVEKLLSDSKLQIEDVTLHRQLEEVRLKMTTEASQKLADMGVQIDLEHISDIIDGLQEIETSYYRDLFAEAGIDASDEQIDTLRQTTENRNALASMPEMVLGKTFETRGQETLDSLVDTGNELKSQLEKAGEAYETLGTEVRKDLGDSIKKAFQNIQEILDDMGLEPTEANIRAVKVLGYNSIAITEESVIAMKNYNSQVQALIDGLKPSVTVEMIKSGVNPLDTPIKEVNQKIEDIQKDIGVSEDEKYSEFLWKLDKTDTLNEKERKAYIGLYRMLNQIEKSDGAAIGSVIKAGKELTLDNLLTAVKTRNSGGVDAAVGDEFGALEEVNQEGESIQEQIKYYRRLSNSIRNQLEPQHLEDSSISLEKLNEVVQEEAAEEHQEYLKERQEQFYNTVHNPKECIAFLEANNQDVTMETMMAAEQVLNSRGWNDVFKKVDKEERETFANEAEELVDQMDSDSFEDAFRKFTEKVGESVQNKMNEDTNSYADVSLLRLMGSSLQLTGSLSRQENYNIPMFIGEQVGNVNVTIQHKDNAGGKVEVSYESDKLGRVQASLTVRDGEIKGFIATDSQPGLDLIQSEENAMTNGFEALGFDVKQVDYSLFSSRKPVSTPAAEGETASTQKLLQAAKVFIGTLSTVERREG